jgi:hypothetical protein
MPEEKKITIPEKEQTIDTEKIKHIYDYTKFHIGMYSTLLTGLIALANYTSNRDFGKQYGQILFAIIIILLIGGIAGALAASRIVYGPWSNGSFQITRSEFWKKRRTRKGKKWSWADVCLTIEHYSFWIAVAISVITFAHLPGR